MIPSAADAVRIADKYLIGESVERRKALAFEIEEAIIRHAGAIATEALNKAFATARH